MLSFSPNSRISSAISKQVLPLTYLYVLGSNRGTETDFIHRVVYDFAQTLQIDVGMMPHRLPATSLPFRDSVTAQYLVLGTLKPSSVEENIWT